jgi:DNA-binding transcriptional MerR regulator
LTCRPAAQVVVITEVRANVGTAVDDVVVEEQLLTINVFARRSRLSLRALRLYDHLGLLSPAVVDPDTGYRRYRDDQLFTARLIVGLRRLDMPLSDVARVLSGPREVGVEVLEEYWAAVERRLAFQRGLAERLGESLRGGQTRFPAFTVLEREVPETILLSEIKAVDLPALRATVTGAIARLTRRAADHGGAVGGPMVFFHGEVNEDSDGPVEVGIPVRTASAATRREPAQLQAYVTVTRAQWEWPQILSAYDAVEEWIRQHQRTGVGAAREVYRVGIDPVAAEPAEEVCDVAVPIVAARR